jgi:hypothetical protein
VFLIGSFVVLETERITNQSQTALIWDVSDYKDGVTGDLGTNQYINLTIDDAKADPQSVFDSVIISIIPVYEKVSNIPEFDIVVLNQANKQS